MREGYRPRVLRAVDHYHMGMAEARTTGTLIRYAIKFLSRLAGRNPALVPTAERSRRYGGVLAREAPQTLRELAGLARCMGMSIDDLLAARMITQSLAAPECTNFGAVPPATGDDTVMVSWNMDAPVLFKWLMGRFPLYVRDIEGTIPYVCFGFPALFSMGILNAEGLCCVINAVGMTDDGEGLSQFELNNMAMESCATVDEAEKVYAEGPRGAIRSLAAGILMNWNMIWADSTGDLSVFEYSHHHFHRQPAGEEGIIASTNHHQFLDRSLTGSPDPLGEELISGSYSRLARMWSLLREFRGRIDPLVAKRIVSDHIPDYSMLREYGIEREWWEEKVDDSTICAHAWNFKRHLLRGEILLAFIEQGVSTTLYSIQVMPRTHTTWLTVGHPCKNPSRPYCWGPLLGVGAEREGRLVDPRTLNAGMERTRRGLFRSGAGPIELALGRLWYRFIDIAERQYFERIMD